MKKIIFVSMVFCLAASAAHADSFSLQIGRPAYVAPVYVAPAPAYVYYDDWPRSDHYRRWHRHDWGYWHRGEEHEEHEEHEHGRR
jgi:hypothetical protein